MSKQKYKITEGSSTIDASIDRIHKAFDPVQLSKIFFPSNDAKQKRASFLAIMFEIRNAKKQKKKDLNHIPKKYGINESSFFKARAKMTRLGLISRSRGYWIFSIRFKNAFEVLIGKIESLRYPAASVEEEGLEMIYVESAKTENIYRQIRKVQEKEEDGE